MSARRRGRGRSAKPGPLRPRAEAVTNDRRTGGEPAEEIVAEPNRESEFGRPSPRRTVGP